MKSIDDLEQRATAAREEIRGINFKGEGQFKELSKEQWDRVKHLESILHSIEWEMVGAISAKIASAAAEPALE